MSKNIFVITGSNTGLGFETAKILAQKPCHIVITSRSLSNLGKEFSHIDVLINNAGVALDGLIDAEDISPSGIAKRAEVYTQNLQTNVVGPDIITAVILPLLLKSSSPRLLFVSSGLGSLTMCSDPTHYTYQIPAAFYRSTKSALNMQMLNWHKQWKGKNVDVYAICPGYNATGLGGADPEQAKARGAVSPDVGGSVIADVALGERKGEEGKVVAGEGVVQPW